MNENIYLNYLVILETFYGGFILGILYHTITIFTYFITKKIAISDFFFCICAIIFTIDLFFKTTYFELRYYSILSFIFGFIIYYFFLSPFYKKILFFITKKLSQIKISFFKNANKIKIKTKKKYQRPISKIKTLLKHILSIPLKIKISYNTLKTYKKGIKVNEQQKRFFREKAKKKVKKTK